MPHSSLVLGLGTIGLGLGGSRASSLRCLPVSPRQAIPKVLGGSILFYSLEGGLESQTQTEKIGDL